VTLHSDLAAFWATAAGHSLSGCTLKAHVDFLGVAGRVHPGAVVLCIGVGTGTWISQLASIGCEPHALDIAHAALARATAAKAAYLDGAPLPAGTFDLALSHWVSPHQPPTVLEAQIAAVVPALKPGGLFALHYNGPFNWPSERDPRQPEITPYQRCLNACSCFAPERIAEMAAQSGGKVVANFSREDWPKYYRRLYAAHIVRA
jgi:SAM-dependent methyltransferase